MTSSGYTGIHEKEHYEFLPILITLTKTLNKKKYIYFSGERVCHGHGYLLIVYHRPPTTDRRPPTADC